MLARLLLAALGLAAVTAGHIVRKRHHLSQAGAPLLEDVLLPDPHCGVYVPKSQAVVRRIRGADYYFCSKECAKQFQVQKGGNT